jgi:transcriptional regulator with XRE-family HTH domain
MLGEVVYTYRKARGWKQKTLADKVGLAQSYISMIEKGTVTDVSMATLRQLAQVLGVSIGVLLGEEAMPDPLSEPPIPLLHAAGIWSEAEEQALRSAWPALSSSHRVQRIRDLQRLTDARAEYTRLQDEYRRRNQDGGTGAGNIPAAMHPSNGY